jgi:hypothetical protein
VISLNAVDNYEIHHVYRASDIQELIASAQGVITELDEKPSNDERPAIDVLLEMISDTWELAEDFTGSSDWIKPLEGIDTSLSAMNQVGWQLYAAFVEKDATNPLTRKHEAIKTLLVVASRQNTEKLAWQAK